jgi:5-methylcytosine-specific restriction endonuclease McrBC regulatory subunit McrC
VEICEVEEHAEIEIALEKLFVEGRFSLDKRIARKGYLTASISEGRLRLKATRFIGLIPLNNQLAVRIIPKATISNLSKMIVKAGSLPVAIDGFARGYRPVFAQSDRAIEIYHSSFLSSLKNVLQRGLIKDYVQVINPPKWRGRLMVSQTVNRYLAKGIKYDGSFDYRTLSIDIPENQAIKAALANTISWLRGRKVADWKNKSELARDFFAAFNEVSDWHGRETYLVAALPRLINSLSQYRRYYGEILWTSYAILQDSIPDLAQEGYVSLDSMIVDVSEVFEAYTRKVISERLDGTTMRVLDGNRQGNQRRFFSDGDHQFVVKPDIIIEEAGTVVAVLDAKYKPAVKEQDRYELLAFMEAMGVKHSAFICPRTAAAEPSRLLGSTLGGRHMGIIRVDLAANDMTAEEDKLFENAMKVVAGRYDF